MNRSIIANFCALPSALFLLVIGMLHGVINVSGYRRALVRGEIAARLGESVLIHAVFAGVFMSLLGLLVFLVLPGLRAGSRQAARIAVAIGVFVSVLGVVAFLWVPTKPSVLVFVFFGALLAAPVLIWRREFANL